MGLFSSGPTEVPADIESALISPTDSRTATVRKAIAKKADTVRQRASKCGDTLKGVAHSGPDGLFVITTEAFYDPFMKSVVRLDAIRSVEVAPIDRLWWVTIASRTQAKINYRAESASEAYTIQEHLGFN